MPTLTRGMICPRGDIIATSTPRSLNAICEIPVIPSGAKPTPLLTRPAGPAIHLFRQAAIAAAIFILTLAVFWPANHCDYVNYDDVGYVTQNAHVRQGLTVENLSWALTTNDQANWHPLTWLSLMLDASLFGVKAAAFHRTNVICHALTASIVFLALARGTGAIFRSAMVALLFAIHPLRVESVVWIAERKDVLSALFAAGSLWAYICYATTATSVRLVYYGVSLFCFALSLLSKATFVTLPFLLLLIDYWPLNRPVFPMVQSRGHAKRRQARRSFAESGRLVLEKLPYLALDAACAWATLRAQAAGGAVASNGDLALSDRLANAAYAYVRYMAKMVRFNHLAFFYPYPLPAGWPPLWVAESVVVLTAITAVAVWQWRKRPWLLVGWLWFVGMLIPMIGIVQVGAQSMADRYSYFPCIGLLIVVVWLIPQRWFERRPSRIALTLVLVGVSGVLTYYTREQIETWRDDATLCAHAIAVTDDNWVAEHGLAFDLSQAGRWAQATEHCRESLRIAGDNSSAHVLMSTLLSRQGDFPGAAREYAIARQLEPSLQSIREHCLSRGNALEGQNDFAQAANEFEQGVYLFPRDAELRLNLAGALLRLNQPLRAEANCQAVLKDLPDSPDALDILGLAELQLGHRDTAVVYLAKAAQADPSDAGIAGDLAQARQGSPIR